MIFLKRRRLILWLIKAYIKKWGKTILLSMVLGLLAFFIIRFGLNMFIPLLPFSQQKTIGMVGAYTSDNLPESILGQISRGLTYIDDKGEPKPDVATKWEVKNNGKTYIFHLNNNLRFTDGTRLTSSQIQYNFSDVITERPDDSTIIFKLKYSYSPFLVTVSHPIFKKGYIGLGNYKVQSININGNFVQSINLLSTKDLNKELSYQFYPTEDSLKNAFVLGEITEAENLSNLDYKNMSFKSFPNTIVNKQVNYDTLTTIFYNTQDKNLSDKRLREALSYAIPDNFNEGKRNYGPFPPNSWVNSGSLSTYSQDIEHAKSLMNLSSASDSGKLVLTIQTLPEYKDLAKIIRDSWEKIGVKADIKVVNSLPSNFQVFLGEFNVPKDPDQYVLWHSDQESNITKYKNLRIDKLLEDGRQTMNLAERTKIYSDFQKYLLDDPPATFVMFPYRYNVTRK